MWDDAFHEVNAFVLFAKFVKEGRLVDDAFNKADVFELFAKCRARTGAVGSPWVSLYCWYH